MEKELILDHIGLAVYNVEASAKWYQEKLGFKVIGKFKSSSDEKNVYFLKNGTIIYEIYQNDNLSDEVKGKIDHISYKSLDIENDYQKMKDEGFTFTTNRIEKIPCFWENGCKYFKVQSPTLEEIEFCQIL